MNVDPNVGDAINLVAGLYGFEIINAKETIRKKEPQRNQVIIEFAVIEGPDVEVGGKEVSTVGSEHTEFIDISFEGFEGKGLTFKKKQYQNFVAALGKTMDEFADLDAEDLIGERVNASVIMNSYKGKVNPQVDSYSVFTN